MVLFGMQVSTNTDTNLILTLTLILPESHMLFGYDVCSVNYTCLQLVVMNLRFQGVYPTPTGLVVVQCLSVISAWILFIYLWSLLFLRARNSYSKDTATLSVKEYSFVVYSLTIFGASVSGSLFFLMGISTGRISCSNHNPTYLSLSYHRFPSIHPVLDIVTMKIFIVPSLLLCHSFIHSPMLHALILLRTHRIGIFHSGKFVVTWVGLYHISHCMGFVASSHCEVHFQTSLPLP